MDNLSSLAMSFGKVHGTIVEAFVRGSKMPGPHEPSTELALTRLNEIAKLPPEDFEKVNQIVDLAMGMAAPGDKEALVKLQQIDAELRGKPDNVHPVLLAISSIANDSATTALAGLSNAADGATARSSKQQHDVVTTVVGADVLGAIVGGYVGGKATGGSLDGILVGALGGAILASGEVGAGRPFPVIGVIVE